MERSGMTDIRLRRQFKGQKDIFKIGRHRAKSVTMVLISPTTRENTRRPIKTLVDNFVSNHNASGIKRAIGNKNKYQHVTTVLDSVPSISVKRGSSAPRARKKRLNTSTVVIDADIGIIQTMIMATARDIATKRRDCRLGTSCGIF